MKRELAIEALRLLSQRAAPDFVDAHALVGRMGEFTAASGKVYQCRVTGIDIPPWDNDLLLVEYVLDGIKIKDAMIQASELRPDPTKE